MSSILDSEKNRTKCQKFTPHNTVMAMLDMAEYKSNIIGKSVLENSFGSGNILVEIVRRYIIDGLDNKMSPSQIAEGLSRDVYGIEIDYSLYNKCIFRLNEIANEYFLPPVMWKLECTDALTWTPPKSFDYIIGNPPYITYRDIDNDSRESIINHYESCKHGKFDYCYAFIESGIRNLSQSGKMVQLVPSNIYKNVFGKKLRDILLEHICEIREYPNYAIFENALTSSSMFLYDKSKKTKDILYENVTEEQKLIVPKANLTEKWIFSDAGITSRKKVRFGDRFHAAITVATLYNKAFVIKESNYHDGIIEKEVLREAAAPKALRNNKKEYIIFPYYYVDLKIQHYLKEDFEQRFPLATKHLSEHIIKLNERATDRKTQWFEYGRSQALEHIKQEKLIMSTVVTNKVAVYKLGEDVVPYSGIFIVARNSEYSLADAEKILTSKEFYRYICSIGISVSGESKRITCDDINNYQFEE